MSEIEIVGSFGSPDPGRVISLTLLGVDLLAITCLRTEEVSVFECVVIGLGLSFVFTRS